MEELVRALLVINATLDPAREREIAAGAYPRKDYYELRDALGADILDLAALDERRWTRLARRVVGAALAQALLAWTLSRDYDAVFADQESTGFALAALYKLPFFRGVRTSGRGAFYPLRPHERTSPLPPPAPSGGAWGDASPQTPAIKTLWWMMERVLVSAVAGGDTAVRVGGDTADLTARHDLWRKRGQTRRTTGRRSVRPFTISRPHAARDVRMAGVWGEASPQAPPEGAGGGSQPQAPPEARWTVGPRVGPRGQSSWAGGGRRETLEGAGGEGGSPSPAHRERGAGEGHPRLTMIGHLLSPRGKQALFRGLRLRETIDAVVVHSSLQARLAARTLGLRPDQVELVPYQTDERFWAPRDASVEQQICSAGLEYRDYGTMIQAVADLPVAVVIAAASPWSTFTFEGDERALPAHIRVDSFDYAGLRDLYASSLFVVVPLRDVENQAGITTILEAMAMGKAVVVSHTRGQTDVIRDRRSQSRAFPERSSQPDWAQQLGATADTARGHTGIYVQPGDSDELRRAIVYLLEHPEQARAMGANGRRVIVETMGLDLFTRRMAAVIAGGPPAAAAMEGGL